MPDDMYGSNRVLLDSALRQAFMRIELLRDYLESGEGDNPIKHYCGRVKSAKSMTEKLQRRNLEPTFENAITKVRDAVGIRIICGFIKDVYRVASAIKATKDIIIIGEKDFITSPKPNGYRSYHMIIRVDIYTPGETVSIPIEIQLRTIAQDSWAELEHTLKYKKEVDNRELIGRELKRCSDEMASVDLSLETLREMINRGFK